MISRKNKKFVKIGRKKKKRKRFAPYVYIVFIMTIIYSIALLIVEYRKEKQEFLKETEQRKGE